MPNERGQVIDNPQSLNSFCVFQWKMPKLRGESGRGREGGWIRLTLDTMQGSHNSIQKQLVIKIGEEKATKHPKLTKNAKLSIGHFPGTNFVWPQLIIS